MAGWILRNETPDRVQLVAGTATIELPPLAQLRLQEAEKETYAVAIECAVRDRAVHSGPEPQPQKRERWTTRLLALGLLAVVGFAVSYRVGQPVGWRFWSGGALGALRLGAVVLAASTVVAIAVLNRRRVDDQKLWGFELARGVLLRLVNGAVVLLLLTIGLVLPGFALYLGTELPQSLDLSTWPPDLSGADGGTAVLLGRVLQWLLIVLLVVFPGLMLWQFDREKRATLLDRWLHQVFRLDATVRTVSDVEAKYGRRVEEFLDTTVDRSTTRPRTRFAARTEVLFATVLLTLGWVLVLLNADAAGVPPGSDARVGDPGVPPAGWIVQLFTPTQDTAVFGFLGAYFFTLQLVLRAYVRGDLRAKTYNVVSVRLIAALTLSWLIGALFGQDAAALGLAFFAGVVPETVLRRLYDAVSALPAVLSKVGRGEGETLEERSPLTDLDGVDIYDRTRLAEEGITSVQALARHDLVDLMLSSRLPAARLVDWVDQAVLFLHVDGEDRAQLRRYGVRTATELRHVAARCEGVGAVLLADDGPDLRLRAVVQALDDDEWLPHVTTWRRAAQQEPRPVRVYPKGLGSRRISPPAAGSVVDLTAPTLTGTAAPNGARPPAVTASAR